MGGLHECEQISPVNDSATGGSSFLHLRRNSYCEKFHSANAVVFSNPFHNHACLRNVAQIINHARTHARNLTYSEGNISLFYSAKVNWGEKYIDLVRKFGIKTLR